MFMLKNSSFIALFMIFLGSLNNCSHSLLSGWQLSPVSRAAFVADHEIKPLFHSSFQFP